MWTGVEADAAETRNVLAAHDTMLQTRRLEQDPVSSSAPLKPAVVGRSAHRSIGQRRPATRSGSPLLVSIGFESALAHPQRPFEPELSIFHRRKHAGDRCGEDDACQDDDTPCGPAKRL